ncbi:hypothetical protein HY095_05530 [Candidatus Micrarchaeota archaeon]|nr:hypothetical protein [Candidatus Micrarchaeota archaeon]
MCLPAGWKGACLSAMAFAAIAQVIHTLGAFLSMGYYADPQYFTLWSKIMMPARGPPGIEFFILSFAASLLTGFIFASAFALVGRSIGGEGWRKGLNFGLFTFAIAGVPFTLTTLLLFSIPFWLLFQWAAESLVIYALAGMAFSKLIPLPRR